MKKKFLFILAVFSLNVFLLITNSLATSSYRYVKVEGRKLLVDFDKDGGYEPYIIRGLGYSPAPAYTFPSEFGWCEMCDPVFGCTHPDSNGDGFVCEAWPDLAPGLYDRSDVDLDRDFTLMKNMGVNTIRTWGEVSPKLLNRAEFNGIKVIAGFWVDYGIDFTNPSIRSGLLSEFETYVRTYKDHPAILFWNIGNENNFQVNNDPVQLRAMYSLFNEMAGKAHQVEGAYFHPVSVVNGDLTYLGNATYYSDDPHMNNLDLWGSNVYRGKSFGTLFTEFEDLSQKPLWIGEYGVDAYDNNIHREDQAAQADWEGNLWDQVIRNNSFDPGSLEFLSNREKTNKNVVLGYQTAQICVGGSLMEFTDEYWKDGGEWNASSGSQNNGGFPAEAPDNFFNEEWFGLFAIANNGKNPDLRFSREAVDTLESRFSCIETGNYYYAGPDNGKSCDGTNACCPSALLFSQNSRCRTSCQ